MNLYKEMYKLSSSPGIYALENTKDKRVLIFGSKNPLLYIAQLVSKVSVKSKNHKSQALIKDKKNLKLITLETGFKANSSFDDVSKWSVLYWYNEYSRNGYTSYTKVKPLQLILHVRVHYQYGAMVELRNKAGKAIVVGVFSMMSDAMSWIDTYYPDLDYINPIFACNLETINYFNSRNK